MFINYSSKKQMMYIFLNKNSNDSFVQRLCKRIILSEEYLSGDEIFHISVTISHIAE